MIPRSEALMAPKIHCSVRGCRGDVTSWVELASEHPFDPELAYLCNPHADQAREFGVKGIVTAPR